MSSKNMAFKFQASLLVPYHTDLVPRETVVVFDCENQHVQCKDCFVQQCETALNSRDFEEHRQYGYTIKCPG